GSIVDPREALDYVKIFRRSPEPRLIRKIRGVHHEGFAFPTADRIAHPEANTFRQVLRVHAYDAGIVHHFGEDHHGVGRLHDLVEIVVEVVGKRRRSRGGTKTQQTTLTERTA